MIHIKDHKQQHLFDLWHFLSPKRRRMLDEDWPGLFRKHLLHEVLMFWLAPSSKPVTLTFTSAVPDQIETIPNML